MTTTTSDQLQCQTILTNSTLEDVCLTNDRARWNAAEQHNEDQASETSAKKNSDYQILFRMHREINLDM